MRTRHRAVQHTRQTEVLLKHNDICFQFPFRCFSRISEGPEQRIHTKKHIPLNVPNSLSLPLCLLAMTSAEWLGLVSQQLPGLQQFLEAFPEPILPKATFPKSSLQEPRSDLRDLYVPCRLHQYSYPLKPNLSCIASRQCPFQ